MPTSQIFFLALAFVVGILLGALVSWMFSGREKDAPAPNPELEKLLKLRAQYQERVSLWIERSSGKLMVRMGEQMAADPQQLSDPQRKQLQTLMREWLTWMGFPGSSPAPAVPPATAIPAPSRQAVMVTPSPVSAARSSAANPLPTPAGAVIPSQPVLVQAKKSIVEQINDILQEELSGTPAASKGVRIVEDARQGVVVWVGLERFNGVDAVTDPEVKAVLKAAAAEWERRAERA